MSMGTLHKTGSAENQSGDAGRQSLPKVLFTWFIQVVGLCSAVTFGIFAVFSWHDAQVSKTKHIQRT